MQTFLPYVDFRQSAQCLDQQRLGKQRVENLQIMNVLVKVAADPHADIAWKNHPAVRMWRGYEKAFLDYQEEIVAEWVQRGFEDTCWIKTMAIYEGYYTDVEDLRPWLATDEYPPWLGNDDFHYSHRSSLIRKMPQYYRSIFPDVPDDIEYVWPVTKEGVIIYE